MKTRIGLSLLLACTVLPTVSFADESYAGADLMMMTYDESGLPSSDFKGLQAKIGASFDSGIGVEGRLGVGLDAADHKNIVVKGVTTNGSSSMDLMVGGYLTGHLPVNDVFEVYGLFGITTLQITQKGSNAFTSFSEKTNGTSFSYGAGISVKPVDSFKLNLEYANIYDRDDVTITTLNLGFTTHF